MALAYGQGKSERLLARALASREPSALRIATKIPPKNLKWPALSSYTLDEVFPADHIRACTETSLTNLGMSSVDLIPESLLHAYLGGRGLGVRLMRDAFRLDPDDPATDDHLVEELGGPQAWADAVGSVPVAAW